MGIKAEDVEERFVRGSGPGGQKINKTSSTVCLRHLPSGIEVRCQGGRSQSSNRDDAWALLADKLHTTREKQAAEVRFAKEAQRRRTRPLSKGQKQRRVESKRRNASKRADRRGSGEA
ncbi:MAG TPA: peptide chain release factor-like protein [Opitutaceae bacterium]|nr:peptide chain release factor-like protein [Opitutaceae bacterium]